MNMNWQKPNYQEKRFGFEITMYIALRQEPSQIISKRTPMPTQKISLKQSVVATFIVASIALFGWIETAKANSEWPSANGDIQNTRSSDDPGITPLNANKLKVLWQYKTAPDADPTLSPNIGSVGVTPAIDGNYVYFTDFAGYLYKVNRLNGSQVFKKRLQDYSLPGKTISQSTNTPFVMGDNLYLGGTFFITDPICALIGKTSADAMPFVCESGDGAVVIAVNKNTFNRVWSQVLDSHPAAKITGSISGINGTLFVPVANWEEDFARTRPNYTKNGPDNYTPLPGPYNCCSDHAAVAALNATNGAILWKTVLSPGLTGTNPNNLLTQAQIALLNTPNSFDGKIRGFNGVSAYGHSPTIDLKRHQIYIATSENTTAPGAAEACEKYRRNQEGLRPDIYGPVGAVKNPETNDPYYAPKFKAAGATCATLNQKLQNYGNAIVALDIQTGKVNWAFYARSYDAWNHACAAPDFYGIGTVLPFVFPSPQTNAANCFQDPIGPDYGFGHNPLLIKNAVCSDGQRDLVVTGNKDGRIFALDPSNGKQIWVTSVDPGGIVGGLQWGMATDGQSIFAGSANTINNGRDRHQPFYSGNDFLQFYGLDDLNNGGARGPGLNQLPTNAIARDNRPVNLHEFPSPGALNLPFPTPSPASGYTPNSPLFNTNPSSGPVQKWAVVNMPNDVVIDDVNVWIGKKTGKLFTIAGMISSVDAGTGKINWQRPMIDGIAGSIAPSNASAAVTVVNGVVFAGLRDSQGTLVGLKASNGKKVFQYQDKITFGNPSQTMNIGSGQMGPSVADGILYWGMGTHTFCGFPQLLPNGNGVAYFPDCGNSVIAFKVKAN